MKYEYFIRRAAGLGKAPTGRDPDRYEKMHAHCDVLIAGAGLVCAAALAQAKQAPGSLLQMINRLLAAALIWTRIVI